jgi:hypothetical protein
MKRRNRRVTTWSAVLLQILVSIGLASDVVLCIAADGHVALEVPHPTGPCFTDYERHHPGTSRLEACDVQSHGCRDTVLSQPEAWRDEETATGNAFARPLLAAVALPYEPALFLKRTLGASSGETPTPSQSAPFRTIVLLV